MKYQIYKYLIMIGLIIHFYPYKRLPEMYVECVKFDTLKLFSKSHYRLYKSSGEKIYFDMEEKFKVDTIKK